MGPSSGEARRCGSSASARPQGGRRHTRGESWPAALVWLLRRTLRGRVSDAALPHGSSATCPGWSPPSDRAIPPRVCSPHKLMAVEIPRTLTCSVPWPQAYLLGTSGPTRALSSALRLRDRGVVWAVRSQLETRLLELLTEPVSQVMRRGPQSRVITTLRHLQRPTDSEDSTGHEEDATAPDCHAPLRRHRVELSCNRSS